MTPAPDRPLVEPDDEPHPVSHPYPPTHAIYQRALDTLYTAWEQERRQTTTTTRGTAA